MAKIKRVYQDAIADARYLMAGLERRFYRLDNLSVIEAYASHLESKAKEFLERAQAVRESVSADKESRPVLQHRYEELKIFVGLLEYYGRRNSDLSVSQIQSMARTISAVHTGHKNDLDD